MNASIGAVSTIETQKRRVMSSSSGLRSSASVTTRGYSAIPQIGQDPRASRTISGCIGQVHSVLVVGAGRGVRNFSGSRWNGSRQLSLQQEQVWPW